MAREIHSLMQDADDIDAFAGNFVVARAYVRAFLSHRRMRRYVLDALSKVAGVRLRLIKSPAVGRVIPNIAKVGLSAR